MNAEIIIPANPVMTNADVCDRCPAQAWVGVLVNTEDRYTLRFCAHHYAKHEDALRAQAAFVVDERHRLPGFFDIPADTEVPA